MKTTREKRIQRTKMKYRFYSETKFLKTPIIIGVFFGILISLCSTSIAYESPIFVQVQEEQIFHTEPISSIENNSEELRDLIIVDVASENKLIEEGYTKPKMIDITTNEEIVINTFSTDVYLYFYEKGKEYGIPGEILQAIAQKESGYNPNAISSTNDHGLMQINSCNFTFLRSKGVTDFYDPYQSIDAACYLLENIMIEVGREDWNLILMSYNMGVSKAKKIYNSGKITSYAMEVLQIAQTLGK